MSFNSQLLLFFFSAIGAFNGLLLSIYFAITAKQKKFSNYFLSLLLFVLSIRILKSVFYHFNPSLSGVFIQIGLSACILIGPFLYLYIQSQVKEEEHKKWIYHIVPYVLVIAFVGYFYPYWPNKKLWSRILVKVIYMQWFVYVLLSGFYLKSIFKNLFNKRERLGQKELWLLSLFTGTTLVWLAYSTTSFTSYIVGAISFSFVFYLLLLLLIFKKNKQSLFFEEKAKYQNKKINEEQIKKITETLTIVKTEKLFKNPDIKLSDIAKKTNVLPHTLSQFLNDNLGKSFSVFINEYRIEEAKCLLISNANFTIEAVGYESGFNSKSTFFTTFKSITGTTPAKYKAQNTSV